MQHSGLYELYEARLRIGSHTSSATVQTDQRFSVLYFLISILFLNQQDNSEVGTSITTCGNHVLKVL